MLVEALEYAAEAPAAKPLFPVNVGILMLGFGLVEELKYLDYYDTSLNRHLKVLKIYSILYRAV